MLVGDAMYIVPIVECGSRRSVLILIKFCVRFLCMLQVATIPRWHNPTPCKHLALHSLTRCHAPCRRRVALFLLNRAADGCRPLCNAGHLWAVHLPFADRDPAANERFGPFGPSNGPATSRIRAVRGSTAFVEFERLKNPRNQH